MGLININKEKPIIIVGKVGTGKTTQAKKQLPNARIVYANDCDIDIFSLSRDNGLIIEDVHFKPDTKIILTIIRNFRGKLILTSINQKSIPKQIKTMCKIKRAGKENFLRESINTLAPRSVEPNSYERDTFSLVQDYLRTKDRELICELLKFNKPSDIQLLSWLDNNIHPNKIMFVDRVVKRRWKLDYFYELLSYSHDGNHFGRTEMPKRGSYSKMPYLARKMKIKDFRVFKQLLADDEFKAYVGTKMSNADYRSLGLGEKIKIKKQKKPEQYQKTLGDYL